MPASVEEAQKALDMARMRLADPAAAQDLATGDKLTEARYGRPGQAMTSSLDFCLQQQDPEVRTLLGRASMSEQSCVL